MILGQAEEFKMNKAAADSEGGDAAAAGFAQVVFYLLFDVEKAAFLVVNDFHDGARRVISGFQKRLAGAVNDRVVGENLARHELFHYEADVVEAALVEAL